MIFTRLTLTNFGVYRGRHEFALRPQRDPTHPRPIILFGGKNGAGKTTILEALRLCLYGRLALGTRTRKTDYATFIRQRLHRHPAQQVPLQSAQVGILFEHVHAGVLSTYDAVRMWRFEGEALHETVSLYQNGTPLQTIAPEHWGDFLRDLIPPGLADLFFFDGEQVQALADDDREAETLAAAVRGLLNLDVIDRLHADLGVYLRQQERQDQTQAERDVEAAEQELARVRAQYQTSVQDRAQLQARHDGVVHRLEQARQALIQEGGGFVQDRDVLLHRQQTVQSEIERVTAALRELAAGLLPVAFAPQWCLRLQERLHTEAALEAAGHRTAALRDQAAQVALTLCDGAFQTQVAPAVTPQDWARIVAAVQAVLTPPEAAATTEPLRHPLAARDRQHLLGWIAEATTTVPERLHTLTRQLEQLEQAQQNLEQALSQIPSDGVATPYLDTFRHLAAEQGRLDEQLARAHQAVAHLERHMAQVQRTSDAAVARLAAMGAADARTTQAATIQVVLRHYREELLTQKLAELEQAIADYFNLLCRKQTLVKEVHIDRQRFTVTLYGPNRMLLPKSDLSAGEKQLYATALLWALRSVSGRSLPIIVDTPMGRLDRTHRETLLTHFLPHAAQQVIILSTDTEIDAHAYAHLRPAIAQTFRLSFDEEQGCTVVDQGYLTDPAPTVEVAA
ncbi:MAG: DNA sulfur modification protein DndD [Chloroflexaceae bacterium]|nr:DNA sulfur modification protein DndD [Chloroflexaceae bacterium]